MHHAAIVLIVILAGCARPSRVPSARVVPVDPPIAFTRDEEASEARIPFPGPCASTFENHQMSVRTEFDYDQSGRVVQIATDETNRRRVRSFRYDEHSRLVQKRTETTAPNAYVQVETSHYDANGRIARVDIDDGNGIRWRTVYSYDSSGRMRSREQRNVARNRTTFSRRFIYEDSRLVREEVDNAGDGTYPKTVHYVYDEHGRVSRKIHEWDDRPSPSEVEIFEYSAAGRLVRRVDQRPTAERADPGVATLLNYDDAGNVVRRDETYGNGRVRGSTSFDYSCWGEDVPPDAPRLRLHDTFTQLNVDMRLHH